jgi:hypothetical protein
MKVKEINSLRSLPNAYCLLDITNSNIYQLHACIGFGLADYPVLRCLGQTCTGATYIQEVLYILHLSCVVLYWLPVV